MPDIALGPQLAQTDTVRFVESLRPALDDGLYTVTVTHDLEVVQGTSDFHGERSLDFVVAGPRFVLAPGEIVSCFPPPGVSGDFDAVLPHVLLQRPSLPWERSAIPGQGRKGPPWLALLVLEEGEILQTVTVPASGLMTAKAGDTPPAPALPFAILSRGPGDDSTQTVLTIEIDAGLAKALLPTVKELPFLTGVRDVNGKDARALVVANRLPWPNKRNYVHLVSLESQYDSGNTEHWARKQTGNIRFVSLAHWDFFCQPSGGDLAGILKGISPGRSRLDPRKLDKAFGPVQAGAVPVEYRLATGERTAAWYHGPFAERDHSVVLDLPARQASDLVLLERATGMRDISYAAAWEVGRLLALRDSAVGVQLHQWKRQVAQTGAAAEWVKVAPELVPAAPASPVFPLPLRDWFENALSRLAAVPFNYLVPEQALLPPETIRFFTMDSAWMAALFDGAFSIGRSSERQRAADRKLRDALPAITARSGILLRSAAVEGWPDLVVDGFDAANKEPQILDVLRFERLAKDTLLVLFTGALGSVDVHLHPQAMHFGLDQDNTAGFTKNGKKVPFRAAPSPADARVIDIEALWTALGATGSHDFALQMLEAAPKASYSVQTMEIPHRV